MRIKTKIIIAGSSMLALMFGFFVYMNISSLQPSKAAVQPYLIPDIKHSAEMSVSNVQLRATPPAAKGTEIVNYRLAKKLSR